MVEYLQITNAILIVLCGILTSVFIFKSKPGEILHSRIKLLGAIYSATVTSVGILLSIAAGEEVKFLEKIWPILNRMSQDISVLLLLHFLTLIACSFLLYQLLWFRSVEFTADKPLRVFTNDDPSSLLEIGMLQPNKPCDLRLRVGRHRIVGEDPVSAKVLAKAEVTVSWLRNRGILLKASPSSDFIDTSPSDRKED